MGRMQPSRGLSSRSQEHVVCLCCAASAALWAGSRPSLAVERTQGIFLSGAQAPGLASGVKFSDFVYPSINNSGQVTFAADLTGSAISSSNSSGVWFAPGSNTASLLARQGDQVPGLAAGTRFAALSSPRFPLVYQVRSSGQAGLVAPTLSGTTSGNVILYGPATGTLKVLADSGQPWPSGQGSWSTSYPPILSAYDNGRLAITDPYFNAFTSAFSSMWAGSSSTALNLVIKPGQAAGGIVIQSAWSPQITSTGKTTFGAGRTGPFVGDDQSGFFVASGTTITTLLKYHDPAPGYPTGTIVNNPTGAYTAPAGAYVVTGTTTTGDTALWKGDLSGGALSKLYSRADFLPLVAGATGCALGAPLITPASQIFVTGTFSGTGIATLNDSALCTGTSTGDLKLLIRENDPIHGGAGSYDGVTRIVNAAGQVLLPFRVNSGSTSSNYGLAGYDPSLGIVPLVKVGDQVEIAPNVKRTIKSVGVTYDASVGFGGSYNDGLPSPLNDLGQVVFGALFTDNTQAILTTRIPVAGDTNQDGIVDNTDLKTFLAHFGQPGTRTDGDFNGDGLVGFKDFQLLELNFGRHPPAVAAPNLDLAQLAVAEQSVPEPAIFASIAASALFVSRRRRELRP